MPKRRPPSDADLELFRDAVGEVKPIAGEASVHGGQRPPPVPRQRLRDEKAVLGELLSHPYDESTLETGEELLFERPGMRRNVLRNLRRGHYVVEDEVDLHGLSADEARVSLTAFLNECLTRGLRCVRVIHGKGRRSSNQGPVIKPLVNRLLRLRSEVLAFCSARPVDGGTGAAYVLLRRKGRAP